MPKAEAHGEDVLLKYRAEFPILEHYTYMISHSLGAMPRAVPDKLREFADLWNRRGIQAWEDGWWERRRARSPCIRTSRWPNRSSPRRWTSGAGATRWSTLT